jgi:hypothetical protein
LRFAPFLIVLGPLLVGVGTQKLREVQGAGVIAPARDLRTPLVAEYNAAVRAWDAGGASAFSSLRIVLAANVSVPARAAGLGGAGALLSVPGALEGSTARGRLPSAAPDILVPAAISA